MARIAVAATAPFGADVLERLAGRHDVALLLTRPDKPRGRGRKVAPTAAKEVAERLGVPVAQPARLDEDVALPADTVVGAASGRLIPEPLLSRALWLNVHPSLLPRWRGAAPVERALIAGDPRTGVTIHRTTAELDAGPIAAQEAFDIAPEDDAGSVFARSAEAAARLLGDVLASPEFTPQPAPGITYAEQIAPAERAFAQRLAYGSVQRVRTLDHAIETLGKRPVRKLDPPVRASLRLGAYQLAYTDTAPHAAANESVELVRRARLERAVPFTNAVMRRLAQGIHPLLDSLPEGPLKESYPDWISETFTRDLGPQAAIALMRAMNEPLETVVRLVRGDAPGEPTDLPGAYRVHRVDDLAVADGLIWPQSRGSQLAGLVVGSQEGERVLDLCAAPGGKASQLRGEVTAVEIDPNRARELREKLARVGRSTGTGVEAGGTALPPELHGVYP